MWRNDNLYELPQNLRVLVDDGETKARELNILHIFVGWASRPSHKNNKNCKLFNSHS